MAIASMWLACMLGLQQSAPAPAAPPAERAACVAAATALQRELRSAPAAH